MRFPHSTKPLLPLFAGFLLLGCDQQPVGPAAEQVDLEPRFSHVEVTTANATWHPMNGSQVRGRLAITDDGSSLTVTGTARGLDPSNPVGYVSLFYGVGSVPGGPHSCEPAPDPDNRLTESQMFIGVWVVAADGTGTLNATMDGAAYAPVERIITASIRDLSIGDGVPQESVRACGQIAIHPGAGE